MDLSWNEQLRDQFDFHWGIVRPRLGRMSDEAYFFEPVGGCWSVRPRGTSTAPVAVGQGAMTIDYAFPEPSPPPVTTIAWRLAHITIGVLAERNASHFGRAAVSYETWEYAPTAAGAIAQLDAEVATWSAGVAALGEEGLARPCGPAEGPYADHPLATLVLHINRELLHHLSEVALMLDLHTHAPEGLRPTGA
ncbi:DinB family protein [Nocardioides zeae]|uniref:DinB family protein n=1 Tax=Nocardioides imazamoxiresistens TaxID=3231893 RepID=A0ABU3PW94_9ACTN|nr:DinB family protein [Nocardioides zeae]MDT9593492.1 DinB family protein [Nocardioides zeae]